MALIPKVRSLPVVILSAVILVFGLYLIVPDRSGAPAVANQIQASEISYVGVEGQTALELLQASHQVEVKHYDFGDQVIAIDGVAPDSSHFWAYYVNDKLSDAGAGVYQTKSGERITWKLDTFQ